MITRPLKWIEHFWQHVWDAVYCKIWVTITLELECFETRSWFQSLDSWWKSDTKIVFPCSTGISGGQPQMLDWNLKFEWWFRGQGIRFPEDCRNSEPRGPTPPCIIGGKNCSQVLLKNVRPVVLEEIPLLNLQCFGSNPKHFSRFGFHWCEPVCGRCRGIGSVMRKWWCRYQVPATVKMIGGYFSGFSIHFDGFSSENPHKRWEGLEATDGSWFWGQIVM
jgi:hypothetical protein